MDVGPIALEYTVRADINENVQIATGGTALPVVTDVSNPAELDALADTKTDNG